MSMKQSGACLGVLVALWSSCGALAFAADNTARMQLAQTQPLQARVSRDWSVTVVSDDLSYPWDIVRTGGRLVITEAAGSIVIVEGGKLTRYRLETSDAVVHDGGGGLLGIALAQDFANSGRAFLYHSYRIAGELNNKVIEARFDGNAWREVRVLLDKIPGHRLYNGGRLAIGPDNHLYVTTGWTENRDLPQDFRSFAGKILRMTTDGNVPADNPLAGSLVYSFGHRNPQGLAWSKTGELFVAEHGQSGNDEINIVTRGGNYGWPIIEGGERRDGMQTPFVNSGRETWAPSGVAFAGDDLLVTALAARGLYVLDRASRSLRSVFSSGDRLRAVLPVGDEVYVVTTNRSPRAQEPARGDRLLKLAPSR
jgi:glucose/arabinose dehydrogenase